MLSIFQGWIYQDSPITIIMHAI